MKVLHAADLHLDSAFCGTDVLDAQERREAQRGVLRRIFDLFCREKCDLMLLAGDLFDSKYVTPETEALFLQLARSADKPIVIAPGNHDPYVEGSLYGSGRLPEKVFVFSSPELQCFELEELKTRVFGYAFTSSALRHSPLAGNLPPEKGDWLHLLCAHGDTENPTSRYAPLTPSDIERFEVDYAALGHVHNPADAGGAIRYSGFVQGRGFDELGDGGVWIVTVERGEPALAERYILSEERFVITDLEVSGCEEDEEIQGKIREACREYGARAGTHLRVNLTGAVDPELVEEAMAVRQGLLCGLVSLELRDLTLPVADGRALSGDVTLRGAFYRALLPQLMDDDPEVRRRAALSLQIGLAAIDGRHIPGRRIEK